MGELAGNLLVVSGQVVTLFLMMGVGFVLSKRGRLSQETLGQLSHLLLYIVGPCIIIHALQTEKNPQLLQDLGIGLVVNIGYYLVLCVAVLPLFRRKNADTRATLQFGMVYANTSFMGLPLVQAVLGDEALIFGVLAVVVFTLFQWTHGVVAMGGMREFSLRKALLNPGTISLAIGLPLFLTGLRLPSMVGNAVGFLSDLNTPLAMVVVGGQMAGAEFGRTFRQGSLYAASAIRLVAAPLVVALALLPLRLTPLLYCTCVVLAAAPVAGTTGIFAQRFGRDTSTAAQFITLSTLLSIVTLPLFAVLAQALGR